MPRAVSRRLLAPKPSKDTHGALWFRVVANTAGAVGRLLGRYDQLRCRIRHTCYISSPGSGRLPTRYCTNIERYGTSRCRVFWYLGLSSRTSISRENRKIVVIRLTCWWPLWGDVAHVIASHGVRLCRTCSYRFRNTFCRFPALLKCLGTATP